MKYIMTLVVFSLLLQAEVYINWQPLVIKDAYANQSGHGGRKAKQFQVNNYDNEAETLVYYLLPTLEKRDLLIEDDTVSLPHTGMDNYHALVVNQTKEKSVSSSVRYIYSHGKPSRTSPTKITQTQKSDLEIAPILLPREHDRYTGSDSYDFELRFKGEALTQNSIIFTTNNGMQESFRSDAKGLFRVTMPNDFKDVQNSRRKNKPAEFILAATYIDQNITYTTTLAMPYHVNPVDYWQSQKLGLAVLIIGLVLGLYLFRNINKKKKRRE